jgi:hypothetical protein
VYRLSGLRALVHAIVRPRLMLRFLFQPEHLAGPDKIVQPLATFIRNTDIFTVTWHHISALGWFSVVEPFWLRFSIENLCIHNKSDKCIRTCRWEMS